MAIYKRKGSPYFFVGFEYKGQKYRQSTRTKSRELALQYEANLRKSVYQQVTLGQKPHVPMRFADAVEKYVTSHLKTKVQLPSTQSTQGYMLDKLTSLVGPDTPIHEITTRTVNDLKERIYDGGNKKPATANQYLATLRAILRKAHREWDRLDSLPRFTLFPLKNERTRWLEPKEEVRLLDACERVPHLHDLAVFLIDTGSRLGEACRLTWPSVDLPESGLGSIRIFGTKTQLMRTVPMTKRVEQLLRRLRDDRPAGEDRVFLVRTVGTKWRGTGPRAKPITHPHGSWKTAIKAADLPGLRLHDLRHTFASRLVQKNVPLLTVSKLLGHANIRMTMRYAHLSTETLRDAVATLD